MPRRSFRDRFFTPPVAHAITSPSGILLAGATAAAGILIGLPVAGVVVVAAGAFAARVAVAIPRDTTHRPRIDIAELRDPWRGFVEAALDARRRFADAVNDAREGPLRDRLEEIAARVDDGVDACWRVAKHGHALSSARRRVDAAGATRELTRLTGSSTTMPEDAARRQTVEALQSQIASAQRMDATIKDAGDRLRLLDARLDEAAARAIELSATAGDVTDLTVLSDDVDGVVGDLEALRQGIEATGPPSPGAT